MRILQIIDSLDRSGGAEQALASTGRALVERGMDLDVAYLRDRAGLQDELRAAGVTLHAIDPSTRVSTIGKLARLLADRSPDLVHTTLFESDITGRLAALRMRTPVVSSLVNVAYGPEHRGDPRLQAWKVWGAQAADIATCKIVRRFHAISDHVATTMAHRLRLRSDRIDVVPRGRDPRVLRTRQPDQRLTMRAALQIEHETPIVLAAARHEYQKGLDVLVEAMASVQQAIPGAALFIAGRLGPQTHVLETAAERCGVERMCLLGPRDDVPALMGAADVFCAPSRWEGLGSAVIEAMGVGVPVVASDVPALREALGSDDCARLVPPDDPRALSGAIANTLSDRRAADTRAVAARQRFAERYTLDVVVDRMVTFYERALNGRPVSR